jgi:hypothetical protein
MLAAYREYGPVYTVRILHGLWVLMIGPEANHYMTVSHASNFRWRDGGMGELRPLVGDGLLTTDGETHRLAIYDSALSEDTVKQHFEAARR